MNHNLLEILNIGDDLEIACFNLDVRKSWELKTQIKTKFNSFQSDFIRNFSHYNLKKMKTISEIRFVLQLLVLARFTETRL